jgi:hypothetical protein
MEALEEQFKGSKKVMHMSFFWSYLGNIKLMELLGHTCSRL